MANLRPYTSTKGTDVMSDSIPLAGNRKTSSTRGKTKKYSPAADQKMSGMDLSYSRYTVNQHSFAGLQSRTTAANKWLRNTSSIPSTSPTSSDDATRGWKLVYPKNSSMPTTSSSQPAASDYCTCDEQDLQRTTDYRRYEDMGTESPFDKILRATECKEAKVKERLHRVAFHDLPNDLVSQIKPVKTNSIGTEDPFERILRITEEQASEVEHLHRHASCDALGISRIGPKSKPHKKQCIIS